MENIVINNKKYKLESNREKFLIYQYCYYKGIELPCFCYNENLEIAGNCRICLVEVSTTPKLLLACATKVENNMVIKTNTNRLKRVRQSVIEFLLINHPLDCPICDQGGECDLQNITQAYGLDRGRFYEFTKRSVLDKESGFFIKTIMTRCIHCTRCVRFFKEIESKRGFGIVGRGEDTEIITRKENLLSILSGNVVDICPVGALTSKAYTFKARPWELNKYENIDILDSMCSSISLDFRNNKILRILPVSDSFLNKDWITNITRYFFDSLYVQRLIKPFLILKNTYLDLSWKKITEIMINKLIITLLSNNGIGFFLYEFFDLKSLYYLKKLNLNLGLLNIFLSKQIYNNFDFNFFYFFNTTLLNFNNCYYIFFLALNLRLKMPLLNSKLRLKLKKSYVKVFSVGFISYDFSFSVLNLGNTFYNFFKVLENNNMFSLKFFYTSFFLSVFFNINNTKNMSFFVGDNFFYIRNAYKFLLSFCFIFFLRNKDLYFLFTKTIDLNFQELNISNRFNRDVGFFYNFFSFSNTVLKKKKNSFSILQNSVFSNKLKNFNLVLPTVSFFEYNGLFFNYEGRLREKLKVSSYGNLNLKSNVDILRYFFVVLKTFVFFYNFDFKLLVYFNKLLLINYDVFFFSLKRAVILSSFLNIRYGFIYNIKTENIKFFDYIINLYKFKNIYKTSLILNKASNYLNSYISTYVV